ncbi:MAG: hypothetical protein BGN85_02155 [Alphaproteobacteria bacterium 64-11]|nr:hypothetical protein [Alphaproteobacteria bacterium]OJU11710.1 MAG: hypothetical protein BGN85_02155 [Alphaproteobacteria bacterium 64-11]
MTALDMPAGIERLSVSARPIGTHLWRAVLVLVGFSLLTALWFWPLMPHLSGALLGPPEDNMQDFWNSWHTAKAAGWHDFFHTRQIRFPEGTPLYYHSFAYPQVFAVAFLARLFGNSFATLVTLHNLTLLASFPLAAMGAFYLARHLIEDRPGRDLGAAAAGFIFAFNPWHVAQAMHHAHVSTIQFLPLFVLCYLVALKRRSLRLLGLAALLDALSALSCWYFFFYLFYFMAFHLLYLRIRGGRWPWGWNFAAPTLVCAGAVVLLMPWLVPMAMSGLDSSVYYVGNNMFVADVAAYLAFPPTHLLAGWGKGVYAVLTGNAWEATVYLGLVASAVFAAALWTTRRAPDEDRRLLRYGLGGMIFFAAIASGDCLHVGGHVLTWLHMPSVALSKLPFFANVRTPARAIVMVYLFLGLGAAQALVLAWTRGRPWRAGTLLVAALMLLDFYPAPSALALTPAACPPALSGIAADPQKGFGVLDLPGGYENGNAYMMLSACHGRAIVAGETARQVGATLLDRLETRNLAVQRRQLADAQVKYIVLHNRRPGRFAWRATDGDKAAYEQFYTPVWRDRDMTILKVH